MNLFKTVLVVMALVFIPQANALQTKVRSLKENNAGNISFVGQSTPKEQKTSLLNEIASKAATANHPTDNIDGVLSDLPLSLSGTPSVSIQESVADYPSFDKERRVADALLRCQSTLQEAIAKLNEENLTILRTENCARYRINNGSETSIEAKVYFLALKK